MAVFQAVANRSYNKPDPSATGAAPTYPLPGSVWAASVSATPIVKAKSSELVANLLSQGYGAGGASSGFYVGGNDGTGRFVVHGASINASYGWTTINLNDDGGGTWWSGPQGIVKWPVPIGWETSGGSDAEIIIWDEDPHTQGSYTGSIVYNAWSFQRNTSTPYPGGMFVEQMCPTDGSYEGFGAWSQDSLTTGTTTASGAPYIVTNITYAEWLYGQIDHALALTIASPTAESYHPAVDSDGSGTLGASCVPYGTLFYLPASVSMPSFGTNGCTSPLLAEYVFTALQKYGMYAVDQTAGNGCDLGIEAYGPWAKYNPAMQFDGVHWPLDIGTAYNAFKGMPWSELQVIVPTPFYGTGGGGSSSFPSGTFYTNGGGNDGNYVTLPSTIEAGDTLLVFVTYTSNQSAFPSGWSEIGLGDKGGQEFACWTKTAVSGDAGASFQLGFSGNGDAWWAIDVKGSPGASVIATYSDYGFIATVPATLSSTQNISIMYASASGAYGGGVDYWPDGYTQIGSWASDSYNSGSGDYISNGVAYRMGAAYGNDAFVPEEGGQNCLGFLVAA